MSYILDALRRADAERERGSVPGLHSQPVPPGSAAHRTVSPSRPWAWIAVGLAAGVMIPLVWLAFGRETPPQEALAPAPVAPAIQPPPPAPRPAQELLAEAEPGTAVPSPVFVPAAPAAPPVVERVEPPPAPAPAPVSVPARAPTAAMPAAPAAAPAGGRIYSQAELPDDVRRSLPALAVNGSVYSSNPADRLLILNGRPVREGEQPAPGLTLEEIRLKSAVLRFRDYRYTISY